MEKLIIVRHGDFNEVGHLTDSGKNKIKTLAETIHEFTNNKRTVMLSSTATRAVESAEIIGNVLGIGFEKHEILWCDDYFPEDHLGTLQLVRSYIDKGINTLILVTHYEYADYFPEYFASEELGKKLVSYPIDKGEAWVVDCSKQVTLYKI